MSIITSVPALNSIVKGVGSTFTLDKTALSINSVVAASPYYSDMNNWDKVTIVYKSSVGNQSEKVIFDATQTTPTAPFFASTTARDVFDVVRVTIFDFDNGFISVQRADLVTAEFDVDMTPAPLYTFQRNFLSPASQEAFENSATPFGIIQYAASGLRLIQASFQPFNSQIYYTSTLSDYFPNLTQNYSVTVSYEVLSIDAAFVFLKVRLGDGTITMNSGDPRLSVGVHNNEVFTFNTCNVQGGVNSFQLRMNAQDNTEIKFFDYLIESI